MSSRPRHHHRETRPSAPPLSLSHHFISPPIRGPSPAPSFAACHSLSLAPRAKLRRGEAATTLRNSVIYWQFPSQVSGILYLNTSAATLNKTALSIYISAAPGGAAHGTRGAGAVKYLPPLNVNLGLWFGGGGGLRGEKEKCVPFSAPFSSILGGRFWKKFHIGTWNVSGYRDVASTQAVEGGGEGDWMGWSGEENIQWGKRKNSCRFIWGF